MAAMLAEKISDLEHQTWRALQRNGSALLPFLSRDCVMQFPVGLKVSATSDPSLKDIMLSDAFIPWIGYALEDVAVTELGREAALITYRAVALRPPLEGEGNVEFHALCASVWRLDAEAETWLMCFHQQTAFEVE
ncbi:hypothetical protein EPUS_07047 [Endocarpon pusillum Z07020]|uniref:Uncharacterized protein n=1 Tax=Endocarpon pusillum (strain Z07020 / HMAS-L-300199) TaxID=1263415 RepID=U1GDJ9_ENDPU|nr:uncharacterized protein EPUS_07047 [Endocarpon pusillum Z07020]ERF69791.1 hypothetical protein EPUS_07047 [Endocarpon pusillum Z07020]